MKTKCVVVTYDVMKNGEKWETCYNLSMMSGVADNLVKTGSSGIDLTVIERILSDIEILRGLYYVRGSIKYFEYFC